jgi:hypothetical protein
VAAKIDAQSSNSCIAQRSTLFALPDNSLLGQQSIACAKALEYSGQGGLFGPRQGI